MRRPEAIRAKELLARIHFACRTRHVADPETQRLLSSHQASILEQLDEDGATTLTQLAARMGVTASTMSLAIRRLVAEGFVDRRRDPTDGRRVCLRLTQAGARVKEARSTLDPQRMAVMLEVLSAEERSSALSGLALLSHAAESMPREPQQGRRTTPAGKAALPRTEEPS